MLFVTAGGVTSPGKSFCIIIIIMIMIMIIIIIIIIIMIIIIIRRRRRRTIVIWGRWCRHPKALPRTAIKCPLR